nr:l-type lectin-domain containing receptor kinase v.7 [Quercus suber]
MEADSSCTVVMNYEVAARQQQRSNTPSTRMKAQIRHAWQRLTDYQRHLYQAAVGALQNATAARNESKAAYDRSVAQIRELEAMPLMDWPKRSQLIDVLIATVDELIEKQQTVVNTATALSAQLLHMGPHPEVANHADFAVTDETGRMNHYQERRQVWEARQDFGDVPGDHQGKQRIKEDWIHRTDVIEARKSREESNNIFHAIPAELDTIGKWIGGWRPFTTGAATVVSIYIEHDEQMKVIDRVIKKTEFLSAKAWVDMTNWDGPDLRNGATRKPAEVACQQAVQDIRSQVNPMGRIGIARLRHWSMNNSELKYSVYTDYCPYKTFADLIYQHRGQDDQIKHIPEPALWHFFRCLAEAGFAMQFGHTNWRNPIPVEGWKEIIHRDLKPRNVFLDVATVGHFDEYPTPRIGDFGNAFRTTPDDVMNPLIFRVGGTAGFIPPEQMAYIDPITYESVYNTKLGAHSNVYGIGLIMNCLMSLEPIPIPIPIQRDFLGDLNDMASQDPPVREQMVFKYSEELVTLVEFCVAANPLGRVDFATMLRVIDNVTTQGGEEKHLHGMKHPYSLPPEIMQQYAISVDLKDEYAIGMTLDELPPRETQVKREEST